MLLIKKNKPPMFQVAHSLKCYGKLICCYVVIIAYLFRNVNRFLLKMKKKEGLCFSA